MFWEVRYVGRNKDWTSSECPNFWHQGSALQSVCTPPPPTTKILDQTYFKHNFFWTKNASLEKSGSVNSLNKLNLKICLDLAWKTANKSKLANNLVQCFGKWDMSAETRTERVLNARTFGIRDQHCSRFAHHHHPPPKYWTKLILNTIFFGPKIWKCKIFLYEMVEYNSLNGTP